MSDSKKPLDQKVLEWLERQGYPLEMSVAKAFQDAGLYVEQSGYYRDPETDTPREIDVVAGWADMGELQHLYFSVRFCIECKKSKHPWVVFASTENESRSPFLNVFNAYMFGRQWIASKIGSSVMNNLPKELGHRHPFNQWMGSWGTGVTAALRGHNEGSQGGNENRNHGGKDVPYQAMMGAAKASYAIAQQADEFRQKDKSPSTHTILKASMIQPVVVLDGSLFEARLNQSREIEIKQVEETVVLFKYPFSSTNQDGTVIRIVTLPNLQDFAERATEYHDAVAKCAEAQEKAYQEHYKPKRSLKEISEAAQARRKQTPDIGDR